MTGIEGPSGSIARQLSIAVMTHQLLHLGEKPVEIDGLGAPRDGSLRGTNSSLLEAQMG